MKRHFDDELKKIKDKLFRMGLLAEQALEKATTAFFERDIKKAQEVIQCDQEINLQEIEVDELAHELIALYQPAAVDLRLLTMVLKVNNDLERMGDQAVNIAQAVVIISQYPPLKPSEDLRKIAGEVRGLMRDALKAFMEKDQEKAKRILEADDGIDQLNDKIYDEIQNMLSEKPQYIRIGVAFLMVSHNLERVADLATNIAEDVIYLERGVDIRHHIRERREES